MGKLRYFYGTMNSMKSATLLMKAYQFESEGVGVILAKSSVDTRDVDIIKSRAIVDGRPCITIKESLYGELVGEIMVKYGEYKNVILFIDEVQFLSKKDINELFDLCNRFNMDIYCFGLKLSYMNEMFESVERLMILADEVTEIKSMCNCGKKSTTHIKYVNGLPDFDGGSVVVDGIHDEITYRSVCQRCWLKDYNRYK